MGTASENHHPHLPYGKSQSKFVDHESVLCYETERKRLIIFSISCFVRGNTNYCELFIQLLIPVVAKSVVEMLDKWVAMSESGEVEIEVFEWFQTLTEDVITRAAFGSSFEDGKAVYRLQAEQMALAADVFQKVFIPGYR